MNKEIVKAMKRTKKEESSISKWYKKNYKKVWRTILFPIYFTELGIEKYNKWRDSKTEWSEERAKEILSYYIPRRFEWVEEEKSFYVFDNGMGWSSAKKYLKRKDRRFWNLYARWWGGKMRDYLINHFELEGFEKNLGDDYDNRTEITFKLIDKNENEG